MKKLISFIFLMALYCVSVNTFAWNPFKKQNYDECILENMKGVTSDSAAREIRYACLNKTSDSDANSKKCSNRFLTTAEESLVTPSAYELSSGDRYLKLNVHNNNKNITVTGFKVFIKDLQTNKTLSYEVSYPTIKPLTTSPQILVEILYAPKKYQWNIYEVTTEVCR
jgi:hypothetical protein